MCIVSNTAIDKLADMPIGELLRWEEVFEDIIERARKEGAADGGQ